MTKEPKGATARCGPLTSPSESPDSLARSARPRACQVRRGAHLNGTDPTEGNRRGQKNTRPQEPLPRWMKPGHKPDPEHPFADLLKKITALAATFTKAMATEQGKKLRDYLLAIQQQKPMFHTEWGLRRISLKQPRPYRMRASV